jgi:hypothetical protein
LADHLASALTMGTFAQALSLLLATLPITAAEAADSGNKLGKVIANGAGSSLPPAA